MIGHDKLAGVILMVAAAFFSALMTLFVKLATRSINVEFVLFFRFFISWLICLLCIVYQKKKYQISFKSQQKKCQIIRGIIGSLSLLAFFQATQRLSLANANVLFSTSPFFIPLWAYCILKKKIPIILTIPMAIGFIGIIILLQPNEFIFELTSIWAIIAGIGSALVSILSRKISTTDQPLCTSFWDFSIGCIFSLTMIMMRHHSIQFLQLPIFYLLAVGFSGYAYLYLTVKSAQMAPVRLTGPFIYFSTLFAIIIDAITWNHVPSNIEWLGMIMIVLSGTLLFFMYKK